MEIEKRHLPGNYVSSSTQIRLLLFYYNATFKDRVLFQ